VSDAWLTDKHGPEKRFSLGAFDPDYLQKFVLVIARQSEKTIAFANIWRQAVSAKYRAT